MVGVHSECDYRGASSHIPAGARAAARCRPSHGCDARDHAGRKRVPGVYYNNIDPLRIRAVLSVQSRVALRCHLHVVPCRQRQLSTRIQVPRGAEKASSRQFMQSTSATLCVSFQQ